MKNMSRGCLVLFMLPFCGFGVFALIMAAFQAAGGDFAAAGFLVVFGLVFSSIGFGFIVAGFRGFGRQKQTDRLEEENPDEPWLWRKEWAEGRITGGSRATMIFAWIFAGFWNLISWTLAIGIVPAALNEGELAALFVLIFPLVGALLLTWAIVATLRYRRYGISVFRMATVPGVIGRTLRGVIILPSRVRPVDGFDVKLTCVRRITTGSGKNRSTSERILWQEERSIRDSSQVGATATAIPVTFVIPDDAEESSPRSSDDQIVWRLEAEASVPGIDYSARFEVPVFRTAESDIPLTPQELEAAGVAAVAEYERPADSRIYVTEGVKRTEIFYAPARNIGPAIGLTVFSIIWTGITIALPRLGAPIFFPIVFGFFNALLGYVVITMWLGTTRVRIDSSGITVTGGFLGVGLTKRIPADEIDDIITKVGMQSGSTAYYDIKIVRSTGRRRPAGGSIRDKREAERLVDKMKSALGWERSE